MAKDERLEAKIEAQLREWAAELESLKAKADKAAAEVRKDYYEHVDELRDEIEAKLKAWSKALEGSQAKVGSAEAAAKTLVERLTARSRPSSGICGPTSRTCAVGRSRPRRRPSAW